MELCILTAFKKISQMQQIRIILQLGWQHLVESRGKCAYYSGYTMATAICKRNPQPLMPKNLHSLKNEASLRLTTPQSVQCRPAQCLPNKDVAHGGDDLQHIRKHPRSIFFLQSNQTLFPEIPDLAGQTLQTLGNACKGFFFSLYLFEL